MRLIAIDPGRYCGWAYTDDDTVRAEQSGVWDLSAQQGDGYGAPYRLLFERLEKLREVPTTLYYEDVHRHIGTDAAHRYGGYVAAMLIVCEQAGVPYHPIAVQTIKKRATGNGNAGKPAMVVAAQGVFGMPCESDDRADALWLLQCALEAR